MQTPITAFALAAAMLCCSCASMADRAAQDTIRGALGRLIGPAQSYDVDVRGASAAGSELQSVRVTGERITRAGTPVIDHAEVTLRDVRIDRTTQTVLSLAGAEASVRLLATDVALFIGARPGLDAVQLRFHGRDEVALRLQPAMAGLPLNAELRLEGNLVPDGARLNLRITGMQAGGLVLGNTPRRLVERMINPIVDLSRLPAPARVRSAAVRDGALLLEADGVASEWQTR